MRTNAHLTRISLYDRFVTDEYAVPRSMSRYLRVPVGAPLQDLFSPEMSPLADNLPVKKDF